MNSEQEFITVPERKIPVPRTISAQAQAFLGVMGTIPAGQEPDATDKEGWKRHVAEQEQMISAMMESASAQYPAEIIEHPLKLANLYEITPDGTPDSDTHAILFLHGGAFVLGGGMIAAHMSLPLASTARIRAFSLDYRMPPESPFPAALNDAIDAYTFVLSRYKPENIAICGVSAGGGLAASCLLKARDIGLPLPGACILATPEIDLTEAGDTFETNRTVDVVLKQRLTNSIQLYANGHDLRDPYLSALFGDFSKGFPPTILLSGTRDLFLSNTVLMHRALIKADIAAELHVFEAMPHGGCFGSAPEDQEALDEQARFIKKHLVRGR